MPNPSKLASSPLGLTGILLRAALIGLLTSVAAGVIASRFDPAGNASSEQHAKVLITVFRLLSFPIGFGIAFWQLRDRLATTTTPTTRALRAAGVGFLAWLGAYLAAACLFFGWQLSLPPGFAWLVGIVAAVAWWRRHRAGPARRSAAAPKRVMQAASDDALLGTSVVESIVPTMSRFIDIPHDRHKNLFKRDSLRILSPDGEVAYEARMERGWSTTVQVLSRRGDPVASVRQDSLSFSASLDGEHFSIRRLAFSLVPRYEVYGGPWNGSSMKGDLMSFEPLEIEHRGRVLARGGSLVGEPGVHRVELPTNKDSDERFVVCALVMLRLKHDDNENY
jgi:hypothetical protein